MLIAGVDEVGRGCLAGPVVAAAVILGADFKAKVADSKTLSPKKREILYQEIISSCTVAVAGVSNKVIDKINILQASLLAMKKAVLKLKIIPSKVLVDGNICPPLDIPTEAIIKGDSKIAAIAAASIVAKVSRDKLMLQYDEKYPDYGFAKHKAYPTKEHRAAIAKYGILSIHRHSFSLQQN